MGYGNANVICAPEPDTVTNIRLESGDNVEKTEGDDDVVTEWKAFPMELSVGVEEKQEPLFSPLSTVVHPHRRSCLLSRGAASVPPLTYQMWSWLELVAPL